MLPPPGVILRSVATLYPVPVGSGQVLTVQDSAKNLVHGQQGAFSYQKRDSSLRSE